DEPRRVRVPVRLDLALPGLGLAALAIGVEDAHAAVLLHHPDLRRRGRDHELARRLERGPERLARVAPTLALAAAHPSAAPPPPAGSPPPPAAAAPPVS